MSSVLPASASRFETVFAEASRATGTNFDFLLKTAARESGMNANAKAPTSSATGLFQFVEQTWFETMKEAGPQLGYGQTAAKIDKIGQKYYVRDQAERQQILDMRKDPKTSALMAGAYARKNEALLTQRLQREPSSGELYAAHFLGAQGSGKLIELAESRPNMAAKDAFPQQAKANKAIFYERNGKPRSVAEVYQNLVSTVPGGDSKSGKRTMSASSAPEPLVDGLGDRFRKKAQGSPLPIERPEMFQKPAMPSRFGLGYMPQETHFDQPKPSRYSQALQSLGGDAEASARNSVPQNGFVKPAPVNLLPDDLPSQDMAASAQNGSSSPASLTTLPRAKVGAALGGGDVYVEQLKGLRPRAKPDQAQSGQAKPFEESQPLRTRQRSVPAPGAMDLTAFMDKDAFLKIRNG